MTNQLIPDRYDRATLVELARRIDRLELHAYRRGQDVEVNVPVGSASGGRRARLILVATNGSRWSVEVNAAGVLETTLVS